MQQSFPSIIKKLFEAGDLGQKTGQAFTVTKRIRRVSQKLPNPDMISTSLYSRKPDLAGGVNHMMVAMCLETARCLEDKL